MPNDWQEYPKCPYCGAIQGGAERHAGIWFHWTCHSCKKRFTLEVKVERRYRSEKEEE